MKGRLLLPMACSLALLGCMQVPGHPKPGPEVPRPEAVLDFPTLYQQNCSACHGANGWNGPSYPLANPVYQAVVDEQVLQQVTANGEPGTMMPAFAKSAGGSLTDQQITAVVKGMRAAWYKPDALQGAHAPPYRSDKKPDLANGARAYGSYCAGCHGAPGQENNSKAGSIVQPDFLSLVSDQQLRTTIVAGRPDIGQPDWRNDQPGHPMSDQEIADVVGWLASKRPGAKQSGGGSQ